jgi:hypothetical protein
MGALQQKPRSQHFGPFLQQCMPRLQGLSREDLVAVLAAMAQLQLTTTDTQVRACVLTLAPKDLCTSLPCQRAQCVAV